MHKRVLRRKHNETDQNFRTVRANIESFVSLDHMKQRRAAAVDWIERVCNGKRACFFTSGGKDSSILQALSLDAGVKRGMSAMTEELEFPTFEEWCKGDMAPGVEIYRSPLTYSWLRNNPQHLFLDNIASLRPVTIHQPQYLYIKNNRIEVAMYGRRTIDGNSCGKDGLYERGGVVQFNPIYDWSHEEIFAYAHYFNIELAPIYDWPTPKPLTGGWYFPHGTTPWIKMEMTCSREQRFVEGWRLLEILDSAIVERAAAEGIPSAVAYLNKHFKGGRT